MSVMLNVFILALAIPIRYKPHSATPASNLFNLEFIFYNFSAFSSCSIMLYKRVFAKTWEI